MKTKGLMDIRRGLGRSLLFIRYIWRQLAEDACQQAAALLTYQSLFAVVPFFTLMFLTFSRIPLFSGFETKVQGFIFENIVPENVSGLQAYLDSFLQQTANLGAISITFLIVMAVFILGNVEKTFNKIWKVEKARHRGLRYLVYLAVLVLTPLLIGVGIAVSTYVISLPLFLDVSVPLGIITWLPFCFGTIAFSLMYYGVPNCKVPVFHAVYGAVVAAFLFEVLKYLFVLILKESSLQIIYGTFAAVPLLLIWMYLAWMIILFGAEWVKAISYYREEGND